MNKKNESSMIFIPRFNMSDVYDGATDTVHPAFIVDGRVLDGIYVSKYQNIIIDGRACSQKGKDPAVCVDFDSAIKACAENGEGFHLMSAMEWGAIALLCKKNKYLPYGNNDMGKDYREAEMSAVISYFDEKTGMCRTATGSGPSSWSHNGREDGIYDLNGNVWEWCGGLRLVFGEIQVLPDNNAANAKYSQGADSSDWRAIDGLTGEYIIPSGDGRTENSIKLDFIDGAFVYVSGDITSPHTKPRYCELNEVGVSDEICDRARTLLFALGLLLPQKSELCDGVSLYAVNGKAETMLFRGGRFGQRENSGVFKSCMDDPRTASLEVIGFRCAYYKI